MISVGYLRNILYPVAISNTRIFYTGVSLGYFPNILELGLVSDIAYILQSGLRGIFQTF